MTVSKVTSAGKDDISGDLVSYETLNQGSLLSDCGACCSLTGEEIKTKKFFMSTDFD